MSRRLRFIAFSWSLAWLLGAVTLHGEEVSSELTQQIIELVSDRDPDFRAAGLEQVRTAPKDPAFTGKIAAQLSKLDAAGAIGLLRALGDRGDGACRESALGLLGTSKDENIRAAVLETLGELSQPGDLPTIMKSLTAVSAVESAAARQALTQMRGDAISSALAEALQSSPAASKAGLIEVLAARRAVDQLPTFTAATLDGDPQVRAAAMAALGQIGKPEQLAAMIPGVLKAQKGAEREAAEKNVALVAARIENEDRRGEALIEALGTVAAADRDQLLSLVGRVGGKKLINFVAEIATGADPARRQLGIDALSKWPDAGTADKLLGIAGSTTSAAERKQAFQGYVKIAATRDKRTDQQRLERMKQAMKAARTLDEQATAINRTRTAYDVAAMRFVLPYVDEPKLAQVACETIVELAHHREVRDPHKAEFDKALDKVIAVSKNPEVIDRAQRYKRGETWNRPAK